jgi:hypothetical protein
MRKPSAERQLPLPAISVLRWDELPEETRRRAREDLVTLLRHAAVRARRSGAIQEGRKDEQRENHA